MPNRTKINELCHAILDSIVPTEAERNKVKDIINFTQKSFDNEVANQKIKANLLVGGSVGKDTWLRNNHDIDFFVRFDKDYTEEELSSLLGKIVVSIFPNAITVHGSRDYFKASFKGYDLEFIPVYQIKDPKDAKNSMDASSFHVAFVKDSIKKKNLANEIRLLKAFTKAQGAYGAETYLAGFSGYVTELLIISTSSFIDFIEMMENAKPKIIIDIAKHYPKEDLIFKTMPESKLKSPIIIIDPVLKTRNAAASLDYETFSKLMYKARLFFRNPSAKFFEESKMTLSKIKKMSEKRETLLVDCKIKFPSQNDDIFMAKINRVLERINSILEQNDITVYNYGTILEKDLVIYFEIETLKLSKQTKKYGPPVWISSENFDSYLEKNAGVYVEKTFLATDIKRNFKDVHEFVLKTIKEGLTDAI